MSSPVNAVDGGEYVVTWDDERVSTIVSWHPPSQLPSGRPFGASGVCVTPEDKAVIVSPNGRLWHLPGGRPEGSETALQTLYREMAEEACVSVQDARLLGYCRIRDTNGPTAGVSRVRAWFRARVTVEPWAPQFEIAHRRLVDPEEISTQIVMAPGEAPIISRILYDAFKHNADHN